MTTLFGSRRLPGLLAGTAVLALASWGCNSSSEPTTPPVENNTNTVPPPASTGALTFAPDSVIVKFKAGGSAQTRAGVLSRIKGRIQGTNKDGIQFANINKYGLLAKVDLDKSISVETAIDLLKRDGSVEYAEKNWYQHILATPNDTRFNELYGMHNSGQTGGTADADIDAPEAWDNTTGSAEIVVGVVDTGVDYTHPDLAANIWTNPNEIAGNGIDDDANGVIDDIHGFNAITGTGDPMDDHDHGSHCSGTIGGVGNNSVGVAGVNWEVSIVGIKFLSAGGSGTTADAIEGINYAVGLKNAGVNLRVLSNSWGGGGFSQALADSITAANAADILFVAAAGNAGSNNDSTPSYPASYDIANVLAVAATDHNDGLASFSNFGLTSVDLGAPGVNILSTTVGNTYSVFSGTSMATPHVAGAAALVLSANGTLTTAELKDALMNSGDAKPSLEGKTVTGKRLNVAAAVDEAGPPVPRFNMSAAPAERVISQGESTTYNVDISSVAGFTGNVALTVTSSPAFNGTITATPATVTAPGTSTINVATTTATVAGAYTLTITGTSGALTKTRTVSLRVRPEGTVDIPFPSTDTPLAIPDNNLTGINSTINVNRAVAVQEVVVDLNITHTYIGDLRVTLTSPTGTTAVLHDRAGGAADNINQSFSLPTQFTGQQGAGNWVLHVDDNAGLDTGTLNSWTLHLIGVPSAQTFAITATPASTAVGQGETANIAVGVESIGGFNGNVALSATSTPALNAALTFTPASVTAPGTSALSIATNCDTAPGTYDLTITGTSGSESKTATATLIVRPFGTAEITYPSTHAPLPIPDNNVGGVTSTLSVAENLSIGALTAEVHINHTFIGDLTVTLVGPNNQSVLLHNRTGGGTDNINQTYTVTAFAGQSTQGDWKLVAADRASLDAGTLVSWTLRATGAPAALPPIAAFTHTITNLAASFTDGSSDVGCGGGAIASWAWSFGDGATSTAQNPTHSYAAAGTYTVTLTVTDNDGLTASVSHDVTATRPPPALAIESFTRNRAKFEFAVNLTWSGAQGSLVELHRNGLLVDIPDNDGIHRDSFRRFETAYTWKICELRSTFCSNTVSIDVGPTANTVRVTTTSADGISITRVMDIIDEK
ncbi:MAG TPA: S8 family serine peptidase [Kofleriaceae bacterium]|nr:S8 family serine peptidase [Kofleriaceae bacterium]